MTRTGQGKTAVVGWGRGMGHKGHMMLASSVITKAKAVGGDPYFVVSRTVGKDDPLTADEKLAIYKKVFPEQGHIFQAASDAIPDLTRVLTNLNQQGYTDVVVVVGADQVKAFQYLKNYNGKPDKSGNIAFNFNTLDVISRQETGDPSAGEEGPRATPMRNVLTDPNTSPEQQFQTWRDAMSPEVSDDEVRDLMAKAKERMASFSAPKVKAKKVNELSNDTLAKYKTAAAADAKKADAEGDYARGNKRFSGIVKATKKQFANDTKKMAEAGSPAQQAAIAIAKKKENDVEEEKQRLDPSCWKGYRKSGTKMKGGVRVNNCVKVSEGVEDIMDVLINKIITNEAIQNNRR